MNDIFAKSLYESIVKENLGLYSILFETTNVSAKTNKYWRDAISLYNNLNEREKAIFIRIIEQTIIDTISNLLGVIDGSSTLKNCSLEPRLLLNSKDTEGELQEHFMSFIEEQYRDI